ncbi:hypothetical protein BaRGS_00027716, partial [Batillaria attramentaria]
NVTRDQSNTLHLRAQRPTGESVYVVLHVLVKGDWRRTQLLLIAMCFVASTKALVFHNLRIHCESSNDKGSECAPSMELWNVYYMYQQSSDPCIKGQTYGVTPNKQSVFVTDGCRGIFYVEALVRP